MTNLRRVHLTLWVVGSAAACGGTVRTVGSHEGEATAGAGSHSWGAIGYDAGTGGTPSYGGYGAYSPGGYGNYYAGGSPNYGAYPNYGGYAGSAGGVPNFGGYPQELGGSPNASPYTCVSQYAVDPGGTGQRGDVCAKTIVGAYGICMPLNELTPTALKPSLGHDTCDTSLACTLSPYINDGGAVTFTQCSTTAGLGVDLEGRCLPSGLAIQPARGLRLTASGCLDSFLCVPCFDPVRGTSTGACQTGGDSPRSPMPQTLIHCGSYDGGVVSGRCVSASAAKSWGSRISFHPDDCASSEWCVPDSVVERPGDCLPPCTTTLASLGTQYGPGACVPAYVVRDQNATGLAILTQGNCTNGDLCSPCLDPLKNGTPTGACE